MAAYTMACGLMGRGTAIQVRPIASIGSATGRWTKLSRSRNCNFHILNSLEALKIIGLPTLVFWPNSDAGSDGVSRGIRLFREKNKKNNFFFIKNLPTNHYLNILNYTKCLIGNSSSGIREGSYLGTPVVNIGTRQTDRERASNVIEVKNNKLQIINAIKKQIKHGKYKSSKIYGQGDTGIKIAKILSKVSPKIQKKLLTR